MGIIGNFEHISGKMNHCVQSGMVPNIRKKNRHCTVKRVASEQLNKGWEINNQA